MNLGPFEKPVRPVFYLGHPYFEKIFTTAHVDVERKQGQSRPPSRSKSDNSSRLTSPAANSSSSTSLAIVFKPKMKARELDGEKSWIALILITLSSRGAMASALFSPKNSSRYLVDRSQKSMSNRIGELVGLFFEQPDRFKRISTGQQIEPLPEESFFVLQKTLFNAHILHSTSRAAITQSDPITRLRNDFNAKDVQKRRYCDNM